MAGATAYELVVENSEGQIVYQEQTTATALTPPTEFAPGDYRVRVRAEVGGNSDELWSPWGIFELRPLDLV